MSMATEATTYGSKAADLEIAVYLKGYREGFDAALKIAWALAEEMRINMQNSEHPDLVIKKFIDRLKA